MSDATSLRAALHERYGEVKGEHIFVRMRAEASGPFAPGNKLHQQHIEWAEQVGVTPIVGKKKPPTSLPGAPRV